MPLQYLRRIGFISRLMFQTGNKRIIRLKIHFRSVTQVEQSSSHKIVCKLLSCPEFFTSKRKKETSEGVRLADVEIGWAAFKHSHKMFHGRKLYMFTWGSVLSCDGQMDALRRRLNVDLQWYYQNLKNFTFYIQDSCAMNDQLPGKADIKTVY